MPNFLNQPVGGYGQPSYLENMSQYTQGAPKGNMTWGQFISAISSLGSQGSQSSSGNLMNNPFTQTNQQGFINQGFNQSNVPYAQGLSNPSGGDQGSDAQDISELMQLFSLFGGGFGAG